MGFLRQTFEIFNFGVCSRFDVCDSGQVVALVRILDAEVRVHLLRLLVEVLAEELVQLGVVAACRHIEAIVPAGFTVAATPLVMISSLHFFAHRTWPPFHLVLHHFVGLLLTLFRVSVHHLLRLCNVPHRVGILLLRLGDIRVVQRRVALVRLVFGGRLPCLGCRLGKWLAGHRGRNLRRI